MFFSNSADATPEEHIRRILNEWAGRFTQEEDKRSRLVEMTIATASENPDLLEEDTPQQALFNLLRRLAEEESDRSDMPHSRPSEAPSART